MKDTFYDEYLTKLITTVMRMNDQAKNKDLLRNRVNYGVASAYGDVLRTFGHNIDICVYVDDDYLISAKIIVNGETKINFED